MTVLGRGDLSPPRRHRRRGRRFLVLLVVAMLGVGGWFGWRAWSDRGGSDKVVAGPSPCPSPTLAEPHGPQLAPFDVRNGTLRPGLAHTVAVQLRRVRHLPVRHVGNTARLVPGNSVVAFPPARDRDARLIAAMVVPVPTLVARPALRVVELDLGADYQRLATNAEMRAAIVRLAPPTPSPTPSPCASPS